MSCPSYKSQVANDRTTLNLLLPAAEEEFIEIEAVDKSSSETGKLRFAMARYPTTVAGYCQFIEAGGYTNKRWWSERGAAWRSGYDFREPADWGRSGFDDPRIPVTGISFWEAEAYANFRGAQLPTEHEWYFVASNGGRTRYPWGDDEQGVDTDRANLAFFGSFSRAERLPVDRSSKSASVHGVCDLIGNASEWCFPASTATLAQNQTFAVLRGGASWHVPGTVDASFRDVVPLTIRDSQAGIRLVRRSQSSLPITVCANTVANAPRPLGRSIKRPTAPFRQEGLPPGLTEAAWRLTIQGQAVGQPRSFSLTELKDTFPNVTERGLFVCVCRWGQENSFTGVRLSDLLDACKVPWREQLLYLLQKSYPGADGRRYETTVPIRRSIENQALVAWAMDGKPLTLELGWPLRYVDLSLYGYKCVKCVNELIVTNEQRPGWWEQECGYDIDGTVKPGTITVVGENAFRYDLFNNGRARDFPPQ